MRYTFAIARNLVTGDVYKRQPLGFTDFDAEGMLVEGFDQLSTMATIYNYPYYAEDFYFASHRLLDLADAFVKMGGKYLFIDEIHIYKDWSRNLLFRSMEKIRKESSSDTILFLINVLSI